MSKRRVARRLILQTGEAALVGFLCAMMVLPPAVFGESPSQATPSLASASAATLPGENHVAALTEQQKDLQALNRFTFGARPGDEGAVRRLGLKAWFQMQLHPERIDDTAFEKQMQAFPAMQLSTVDLLRRFPSPQVLRQMTRPDSRLDNGRPDPGASWMVAEAGNDPAERAIYADAEFAYQTRLKQVAAAQQVGAQQVGAQQVGTQQVGTQQVGTQQVGKQDEGAAGAMPPSDTAAGAKGRRPPARKPASMDDNAVESILALPPDARYERLLDMSPQEAASLRRRLSDKFELFQGLSPQQKEVVAAMEAPVRLVGAEALETRLLRDVASQRQLQAVMTDFWLNHFSVYVRKSQNEVYFLPAYERDTIVPNSLGKFEDLLVATAESPAMQMYLDNWKSVGPDSKAAQRVQAQALRVQNQATGGKKLARLADGINENYARELMELHTLGVGGGYTQKDVIEVAKCFTGWTIQAGPAAMKGVESGPGATGDSTVAATPVGFVFNPNRHEPGSKLVLGHTIPEGGISEGLEVLHILATSPATAHFISQKLAVRFVSDTPPPALVDRMAATFLRTGGDIKAVLTTMFDAPEFWSPQVYRAKVKTPLEFLTSALRASDAEVTSPLSLVQAMNRLGMPLYGMQTPNGYSWTADQWVSSNALISRMNFALVLSSDRLAGTAVDWPALLGEVGGRIQASSPSSSDPGSRRDEQRLETLLLGEPASARTRAAVLAEFTNPSAQNDAQEHFSRQDGQPDQKRVSSTPSQPGMPTSQDPELQEKDLSGGGYLTTGLGRAAGRGRGDRSSGQATANAEAPLDTMAGLLLGSPEFQRR